MQTRTILVLTTLAASPALADEPAATNASSTAASTVEASTEEAKKEEAYPVSATFGLAYRFNHANFVGTESDQVDFGYQLGVLTAEIGYSITDAIALGLSIGMDKELSENYDRAPVGGGAQSRTLHATSFYDTSLGVSWSDFLTIPVVDIKFSAGLGFGLPTSRASQSAGLIVAISPDISAAWSAGGFSVSTGFSYSYLVNDDPTAQIDCEIAPQNCQVAGRDLGSPNALHDLSSVTSLRYKILDDLSISARYIYGVTLSAVEFPDDEFTSPFAQTGTQSTTGRHGTAFGLAYNVFEKTSVSLSMATNRNLYDSTGKNVTVPLFDFDSDTMHRTVYGVALSQSL